MENLTNNFFSMLPFSVTLIWTVILFIEYGRMAQARKFLAWFSLATSILYLAHAIHFLIGTPGVTHWVDGIYTLCHLLVYPMYYIYIRLLADQKRLRIVELWVLVPAVVVAAAEEAAFFLQMDTSSILLISDVLFPAEIILTFIFARRKLVMYNLMIENYYSDTSSKTAKSVMTIMYVQMLSSLASVVANLIGRDSFIGSPLLAIPSTVLSALIFAVLYVGFRQKFEASTLKAEMDSDDVNAPESIDKDVFQEELLAKINQVMVEKELYRLQGLKVSDVAAAVASNRTYVSNCINVQTGQTFSDFVNSYRVAYVKRKLKAGYGAPIAEIGAMAGFSSDSALFRNFKLSTGMTPAQWLKANAGLEVNN